MRENLESQLRSWVEAVDEPIPVEQVRDRSRQRPPTYRGRTALAAAAAVVLVAGSLALLTGDDGPSDVTTVADDTKGAASTITAVTSGVPTTVEAEVPAAPTPITSPATTSSTNPKTTSTTSADADRCRNSHDPECGPFRWDPEPVNQPMAVEVSVSNQSPAAGEEVTFTVTIRDDGDVVLDSCVNMITFGEPDETSSFCTAACTAEDPPRHGPWDPPPPNTDPVQDLHRHAYQRPGTYTATFAYNQGSDCSSNPYRSSGQTSVTLTVEP